MTHDVPPSIAENIKNIKRVNPDWEYKLFNDQEQEQYIQNNYGKVIWNAYQKINPFYGAARSDFFRYLLLYQEGGLWLDIKSSVTKPLDRIVNEDYIMSFWGPTKKNWGLHPEFDAENGVKELVQFFILTKPRHPFLRHVIDQTVDNINNYSVEKFGIGKHGVLKVTGPIMYTNTIWPLLDRYPNKIVDMEKRLGIKYSVLGGGKHLKLFKNHYSKQREPIVSNT